MTTTLSTDEQQALCDELIAARLAPDAMHQVSQGYYVFSQPDWIPGAGYVAVPGVKMVSVPVIWRPWEDLRAVWHLVERFGLSIRQVQGLQDVWYVSYYEEPFTHATTWEEGPFADVRLMICRVALWVQGRAVAL